jgi:Flp pilus assembly protein TadD
MLPPTPMLATKNKTRCGLIIFLMFTVFIVGCGPPGPRALLKGKKLLARGDYADAVTELKTATSLLATNAQAWNYLGVAEQHAGQPGDAVLAYQRALTLNRDLVETHYNLGCLWLEENKPGDAKTEFTAYTLRRSNAPEGWAKLGVAHLGLRDLASAEKAFNTALSFDPHNAEALNGLGLAYIQRGHPHEAAQDFTAAVQAHPDYGPALLNLATTAQQYLRDNTLALQNYRAYLALTPHPANWDDVNGIANDLEQQINPTANPPKANGQVASAQSTATPATARANVKPRGSAQTESARTKPGVTVIRPMPVATNPFVSSESQPEQPSGKPGLLHKLNPLNWFSSASQEPTVVTPSQPPVSGNERVNTTPSPSVNTAALSTPKPPPAKPVHIIQPAPPAFPRYLYLSPNKPRPGNRPGATIAFAQAQQFEHDGRVSDALDSYREAARLDPSWFEAQYDCGVMAYHLGDFGQSLRAYEMTLAIRPDSADARCNFALVLKAAGYLTDAANELNKVLASNPDDARAHLALGNIYAQLLRDPAQARAHYLKVLQLDPRNPAATDIQFWLSANSP